MYHGLHLVDVVSVKIVERNDLKKNPSANKKVSEEKKNLLKYNESLFLRENNGQVEALYSHWNSTFFCPHYQEKKKLSSVKRKEKKRETRRR